MSRTNTPPTTLGPYTLIRGLGESRGMARWLALHTRAQTNHTLYRLDPRGSSLARRHVLDAVEHMGRAKDSHLLPIDCFCFGPTGEPWLVTPYLGNQGGLLTLGDLRRLKTGTMPVSEVIRSLEHILAAVKVAHEAGLGEGAIGEDDLLVDRHGSIRLELFGLRLALQREAPSAGLVQDDVRAVVELGYRLLTGLDAAEPRIRVSRLVRRADRGLDEWIERGLDLAGGYDSAEAALMALQIAAERPVIEPTPGVLRRIRSAVAPAAARRLS